MTIKKEDYWWEEIWFTWRIFKIGSHWTELDWIGLDWIGLDWIALNWIGFCKSSVYVPTWKKGILFERASQERGVNFHKRALFLGWLQKGRTTFTGKTLVYVAHGSVGLFQKMFNCVQPFSLGLLRYSFTRCCGKFSRQLNWRYFEL